MRVKDWIDRYNDVSTNESLSLGDVLVDSEGHCVVLSSLGPEILGWPIGLSIVWRVAIPPRDICRWRVIDNVSDFSGSLSAIAEDLAERHPNVLYSW